MIDVYIGKLLNDKPFKKLILVGALMVDICLGYD